MKMKKFKVNRFRIKIISLSSPLPTWYKIGDEFWATYDPCLGSYVARGGGAAARCVPPEDCKVVENKTEFLEMR